MLRKNIDLIVTDEVKNVDTEVQITKVIEWLKDSPCRDIKDDDITGYSIAYFVNDHVKCYGKTVDGIHAVVFLGTPKQTLEFQTGGFTRYYFEKMNNEYQ